MKRHKPAAWKRRRKGRTGRPWVVFWESPDGKREQKTFGNDHEAAQQFLLEKLIELGQPTPAADRNITVRAFAEKWLREATPGLSRATVISYRSSLDRVLAPTDPAHDYRVPGARHFDVDGNTERRLRDVTQHDCVVLLTALLGHYAEGTVKTTYRALSRMLKRAVFERVIQSNPMRELWVELPVSVRSRRGGRTKTADEVRAKAMTRAEMQTLLRAEAEDAEALYSITYRCGLRIGEALGLQLDDPDFHNAELNVRRRIAQPARDLTLEQRIGPPKGGVSRVLDLGPAAAELLARQVSWRREQNLRRGWTSPWLFVDEDGQPLDYFEVDRAWKKIIKRCALPARYTLHSLRHSYATHMLQAGAPIIWVARQLGDRVETVLQWYAWALPSGDRKLAGLLDGSGAGGSQGLPLAIGQTSQVVDPSSQSNSRELLTDSVESNRRRSDEHNQPRRNEPISITPIKKESDGGVE